MEVQNSVAVVTGGASGLGWVSAKRLSRLGAKIAILDIEADARQIAHELSDNALFVKTDISKPAEVEKALDAVIEKFGKIDVLLCTAAIAVGMKTANKKEPHSIDAFKKVMDVNLIGTFDVLSKTAYKMASNASNMDGEKGVIITTSSTAAYEGQIGTVAYSASKAAIAGMTLVVARDLASLGIRAMSIAPGVFDTPFLNVLSEEQKQALGQTIPFPKRLGNPEEFAMLVEQIIINPMLNGETVRIDGALRMQP